MVDSGFKWTKKKSKVAIDLSLGFTIEETAERNDITERSIYIWKTKVAFSAEVDRLSLMTDIAGRAERLRIAKKMIRKLGYNSKKDILEWLKYAQGETDGIKLDLAAIAEAIALVADSGSGGAGKDKPEKSESGTENTG